MFKLLTAIQSLMSICLSTAQIYPAGDHPFDAAYASLSFGLDTEPETNCSQSFY
jgi:hypothetical protein